MATDAGGAPVETGQAPEGGTQTTDFERSYNELRPQFTRATQELAAERERLSEYEQLFNSLSDPDAPNRAEILASLGFELDTGPQGSQPADDFVDPLEEQLNAANERLAALESAREQEARAAEEEQLLEMRDDFIADAIGILEKDVIKRTLDKKENEALGNLAIAMENEKGVPDVQAAYELLYGSDGVLELNRKQWIRTKEGADQPPLGTSIPADRKPKTRSERTAYIDERMRAIESQQ